MADSAKSTTRVTLPKILDEVDINKSKIKAMEKTIGNLNMKLEELTKDDGQLSKFAQKIETKIGTYNKSDHTHNSGIYEAINDYFTELMGS